MQSTPAIDFAVHRSLLCTQHYSSTWHRKNFTQSPFQQVPSSFPPPPYPSSNGHTHSTCNLINTTTQDTILHTRHYDNALLRSYLHFSSVDSCQAAWHGTCETHTHTLSSTMYVQFQHLAIRVDYFSIWAEFLYLIMRNFKLQAWNQVCGCSSIIALHSCKFCDPPTSVMGVATMSVACGRKLSILCPL